MKKKKNFCLLLIYVLILTTFPIKLLAQEVTTATFSVQNYGKNGILNYSVNYSTQKFNTTAIDRYEDSFLLIGSNILKINLDGTTKTINANLPSDKIEYIGEFNRKAYYYRHDNRTINSIDLENSIIKKEYDVEFPQGICSVGNFRQNIQSDGSIVFTCSSTPIDPSFTTSILLKFKDNKQSIIDLKEKGSQHLCGIATDKNGNIWTKEMGLDTLYKINTNNDIIVYHVNIDGYIPDPFSYILIDNENNLWMNMVNFNNGVQFRKLAKLSEKNNNITSTLFGYNEGINATINLYIYKTPRITLDKNGVVWVQDEDKIKKLENNKFISKYKVIYNDVAPNKIYNFDVLDETHLIVTNNEEYTYIVNTDNDTEEPVAEVTITPLIKNNNDGTITTYVEGSSINKDVTNIITSPLGVNINTLEVLIDISNLKGGQGKFLFKLDDITLELPINAIDFTGIDVTSYLSFKVNIDRNSTISKNGIVVDLNAAIYDKSLNKIKDLHNFLGNNKAKVVLKLTNTDLNGLDPNKLVAFYSNESNGELERLGGTYDANTNTFTFETPHFSKFILSNTNTLGIMLPSNNPNQLVILPQTGSSIDITLLSSLGITLIVIGTILVFKRRNIS